MAIRFGDRVYDTTETTGQGPFTLSDVAVPTFQRPSTFFANGDRFIGYLGHAPNSSDPPPNEWIVALFEYSSAGPSLSVVEIYDGSSGTSAVSFSTGVKQVYSAPNAGRPGVKVSDGKDADARPTNPVVNDQYIATDAGKVYRFDGTDWTVAATSNTGTVTSVGLTMPSLFAVDKTPVTTSGTIAVTLASQTKATFLAAPTAEDGAPTFRVIAAGDLPATVAFLDAAQTFTKDQSFAGVLIGSSSLGAELNLNAGSPSSRTAFFYADTVEFFNDGFFNNHLKAGSFEGDGSLLTNLDANQITTGELDASHLPTSGVTDATYGSATASPEIAVDKYGRITAAASKTITPDWSNVANKPANVTALAGLTGEADRGVYFTGAGALALFTFTSFARQLADDADAATARGTLGVNTPYITIDLPNGTYTILRSARHAFTINTAYSAVASAGSGTLTVAINGTPVTGLNAAAVTTTPADLTATAANTVSVGNVVTVTVAGLADNETIAATIQGTRT